MFIYHFQSYSNINLFYLNKIEKMQYIYVEQDLKYLMIYPNRIC